MLSVQGKAIVEEPHCVDPVCLSIVLVSPDLNGDCSVDDSDFLLFRSSYDKGAGDPGYNSCCDLNDDGRCDVSDFAFFVQHYLHECP